MRRHVAVSLLVLLLSAAWAGCLAEEGEAPDPPDRDEETEWLDPVTDVGGGGSLVRLPVPRWSVGDSWTYRVEGDWVDAPFVARIGVVGITEGTYRIGTGSRELVALGLVHDLPLGGDVSVDRLAVATAQGWQELVGFGRAPGETWTIELGGETFRMRLAVVDALPTTQGTEPGTRTLGVGPGGQRILVDHAVSVGWITRLDWTRGDELLVGHRLVTAARGEAEGLTRWAVRAVASAAATGPVPVATQTWTSGGDASFLVGLVEAEAARSGRVTLWDPAVRPAVAVSARPDGPVREAVILDDRPGAWRLAATSLGAPVSATLFAVRPEGASWDEEANGPLLPVRLPRLPDLGGPSLL